jgi:hypothetical protein
MLKKEPRGNCRIATMASLPLTISHSEPEIKESSNRNSKEKTNCFIKQKINSRDHTSGSKDHQSAITHEMRASHPAANFGFKHA